MQPDAPHPAPTEIPPTTPGPDLAPVPRWLWYTFALSPIPFAIVGDFLLVRTASNLRPNYIWLTLIGGACAGLVAGIPMIVGLALAARLFRKTAARIFAGIGFAPVLAIVWSIPYGVFVSAGSGWGVVSIVKHIISGLMILGSLYVASRALGSQFFKNPRARAYGGCALTVAVAVAAALLATIFFICLLMSSPIQM